MARKGTMEWNLRSDKPAERETTKYNKEDSLHCLDFLQVFAKTLEIFT